MEYQEQDSLENEPETNIHESQAATREMLVTYEEEVFSLGPAQEEGLVGWGGHIMWMEPMHYTTIFRAGSYLGVMDQGINIITPRKCFLLDLPGELQNRIYRLAVVSDEPVDVVIKGARCGTDKIRWSICPCIPTLADTCTQIRRDVLSIYYAENTFDIGPHPRKYSNLEKKIERWSEFLGQRAQGIRHLRTRKNFPVSNDFFGVCIHLEADLSPSGNITVRANTCDSERFCVCGLNDGSANNGVDGRSLIKVLAKFRKLDVEASRWPCEDCCLRKLGSDHRVGSIDEVD